jgi:hypothetical protein
MIKITGPLVVRQTVLAALLWHCLLLAGVDWVPDAIAKDSTENPRTGQRGAIRSECEPLKDPSGRYHIKSAECPNSNTDAAASVPPKIVSAIPEAATAPDAIQIDEQLVDALANEPILKVDAVGVGLGLAAGGLLYWFLSSEWMAALLLLGLPIWRDLDLLPIVARAGDNDATGSGATPVVVGESLFSGEPDENKSDLDVPRVKG